MWGDPREIERRRGERARERLPRGDRLRLIAEELAAARAEAVQAKAGGNKDKQKACGQLIGQLRQEMQQLGITDADLEAEAPGAPPPGAAQAAPAAAGEGAAEEGQPAADGDGPGPEREEALEERASVAAASVLTQAGSGGNGSDDEGPGLGFDLFGDSSTLEEAEVVKARKTRVQLTAAALQPWGAGGGGGGGKKKGKQGKAAPAPKVEQQLPKALLQQHCQRCCWAAPRFERLAHGGLRLEVRLVHARWSGRRELRADCSVS